MQYRKYGVLILTAGFLAASVTGCKKKNDISRVENAGVLKIAVCQTDSEGTKLCDRVADAMGVSADYIEAANEEEALDLVKSNQADIAMGGILTGQTLEKGLAMSDSYFQDKWYVVTRRGDYSDSIASFEGRMLAVTHEVPDQAFQWVTEIQNVDFVGVSSDKAAAAIEQGALDGYLCLKPEAEAMVSASSGVQVQNLLGGQSLSYGVVTRTADRQLASVISQELTPSLKPEESETVSE